MLVPRETYPVPRIAIVGASGYLGGALYREARAQNIDAIAILRRPCPWLPGPVILTPNIAANASQLEGVSTVYHVAGPNEAQIGADPSLLVDNLALASRVHAACDLAEVDRLVYVSTVHVYGQTLLKGGIINESAALRPTSLYGTSRLQCEQLILDSASSRATIVRLTNAIGASISPIAARATLIANDLCRQASSGPQLVLRSDGQQLRDFIPLRHAAKVILGLGTRHEEPQTIYNLGSGVTETLEQLARAIASRAKVMGLGAKRVVLGDLRTAASLGYQIDCTLVRRAGYAAPTLADYNGAIDETLAQAMRSYPDPRKEQL